jgi:sterol desaturase/sphingolipid hydroxylase (fatty acid hydroxylase superfamily)
MDALLHGVAHIFFSKFALVGVLFFAARLVILMAPEKRDPAYSVSYREVLPGDILAMLVFTVAVTPASEFLDRWIIYQPPVLPPSVLEWPLAIRIVFYLVLADFGFYWVHRLLHTRYLWRAHKWHHSPTYMYWLASGDLSSSRR